MRIVAIETTSAHGSLALLEDEQVLAEQTLEARHYSRQLLQELERLLQVHSMTLKDIGLLAVAGGPGSFTGARIGLTVVKGLMETVGTEAVMISTLQAVAAAAQTDPGQPVLAALDASRGEFYYGFYPHGPNHYALGEGTSRSGAEAGEEGLESLPAFLQRIEQNAAVPVVTPHTTVIEACASKRNIQAVSPLLAPWVGRIGLARFRAGQRTDALRLDAHYIRRSDAEIYSLPQLQHS